MVDSAAVTALVERIAKAEHEYGCGFYSHEPWMKAYDELLTMFGFDEKWKDTEGERLHANYWRRA
jgi:hypothetical protein